ncbi:MAG: glycerol kinase, partial [Sphingomonadales bacterium]|nr:glycerol kinase [Sphingomonadales bacterium]
MALLVIDEGTTSTRAMLFDESGACLGCEQRELTQAYPRSGWVEHDAEEIWRGSLACARAVVEAGGGARKIAALGITNQRETIVFWSRSSGRALAPAIVWQDRRTADLCRERKEKGDEDWVQRRTGLLLDPY